MNNNFPHAVTMTVSWIKYPKGNHPLARTTEHSFGLLLSNGKLRYVIGVSASENSVEDRKVVGICGIDEHLFHMNQRKSLSRIFEADIPGRSTKNWTLLGVPVFDSETPGRTDPSGKFIPATPCQLQGLFPVKGSSSHIFECFNILATEQGKNETSTLVAKTIRTFDKGLCVEIPSSNVSGFELDGALIVDQAGKVVALSIFSEIQNDVCTLTGIYVSELFETYGRVIDQVKQR